MKKVRVGLIGCGAFARAEHLPNCQKNPKVELTWCCSRSKEKRRYVEQNYGPAHSTPDAREVFEAPDVDMVILSVPHSIHEEMVTKAAASGKHILCEKPMAMDMEEAYRMVRAVKEAGVKLCVDYNRRYAPSMQDLKAIYQEHRKHPVSTPWKFVDSPGRKALPEEETTMLMIRINDESSTYRPVHIDWITGGGQIIGESCHWLDLAGWLLEDVPVRIYATGSTRINHIISIDYASGSRACIFFSSNGTFDYPKELYEIQDHAALFRNLCFVENEAYGLPEPWRKVYPLQFDDCPDVGREGGLSGYIAKLKRRGEVYAQSGKKTWLRVAPDKGHYKLLDAFVDSILDETPSPISEIDGAKATYLSLRAIESIRLGKPLPVNIEDFEFFVW